MKTFINWLKWCTSRQNTKKMKQNRIHESELFWVSHPNTYVSMWMKHDWFEMDRTEFVAKYIIELQTSRLEEKKQTIKSIVVPIWESMDTSEKYMVLGVVSQGKHYADTFNLMLDMQEYLRCDFLKLAIKKTYHKCANRNYSTNYFATFGIKSVKKC